MVLLLLNQLKNMKKQLPILLITLICSLQCVALESKTDKIFRTYRFGLFFGPSINTLKPTAASSDNYSISKGPGRIGFTFGINADYNVNERYTLYTGIGLDWRGGNITVTHDDSKSLLPDYLKTAEVKYKKMQYLTFPFGLKLKAFDIKPFKVFAQTGFDLCFLLSQKGNYTYRLANDTIVSHSNEKLNGLATVVPVNMGWFLGAGVEYNVSDKNSFYASLLYRNGFIDATTPKNNDNGFKFSDGNIRSNSIILKIGYFF